jgi:SNF2 family DNA or RNA helicase
MKLFVFSREDGRYRLAVQDEGQRFLPVAVWKDIVFSRHGESFFGTLLEEETVDFVEGVVLSGWALVSLFGREAFNRFIDWDWSEDAEILLAASGALYEGIVEKDWHPDFSMWEHEGGFRWRLPERVVDEFDPSFWEQAVDAGREGGGFADADGRGLVGGVGAEADLDRAGALGVDGVGADGLGPVDGAGLSADADGAGAGAGAPWTAKEFLSQLYNDALDTYLTRNPAMQELFGPKLDFLKKQNLSGGELARYFDEDSWLEWVGIKENTAPFTIGLRLDEPVDGIGNWTLEVFLRDKKNIDNMYGLAEAPGRWKPFLEKVDVEQERWGRLIPWLAEDGSGAEMGLRTVDGHGAVAGFEDEIGLEDGTGLAAGISSGAETGPGADIILGTEISPKAEISPSALRNMGPRTRLKSELTEEEAWMFLTEASETLVALNVEILLPSWWQAMKNANLKVKAALKGTSSHRPSFVGLQAMLDFNWRFSMNGVDLSEDEFNKLVEEKRRLVYIRGRWVKLDPGFIRQIQDLMKRAEKEGLHVRDLLEQELVSEAVSEEELENPKAFARIQIELNRQWKQMINQLAEIKEIPVETVPAGLHGELRPYQQLGMSWLWFLRQYGFGACLADDMGLGKTVQLISYLLMVKAAGADEETAAVEAAGGSGGGKRRKQAAEDPLKKIPAKAALIICPTSVLGNWQKELERFAPEMNVYLHYGSGRLKGDDFSATVQDADVVLTSYGLSHLDNEEFDRFLWSSIAIDEAQNIKNPGTKQSRAVRKLRGRHHIALTGTPMENRLSELWSIFDFTNHGYLGSIGQFQKKFVIPIEKDDSKNRVRELQALIRPFLLRRTKKDEEVALNLPDKQEQKEYCPLTAEQASLYEQLVKDTFAEIETLSGFERKGLILQMLSRLKQLCNHPALYLKEKAMTHLLERSNKMEKLVELVDAVLDQQESCLIFTQYIEMGEMIKVLVKRKFGVDVPFLNGSVPKTQRDTMIERFQNREFPVFLLSLKAGGTGLNLTAANHVIHYDRWWNPAVENQATDRAYRIGQQRFVHVHKLICTGTLEEKIDAMLEKKQFLNDQIIQSENWITELSTDELRDLVLLGR